MSTVYYFSLPGITCINCILPVKNALTTYTKIQIDSIAEDVIEKRIAITVAKNDTFTTEEISQQLRTVIEGVGVDCIEISHREDIDLQLSPTAEEKNVDHPDHLSHLIKKHLIKGIIGTSLGVILMALMMSGLWMPMLAMSGLVAFSSLLTVLLGAESYHETVIKLFKAKMLTMDALFTVSTLTIIGVSIASFFFPFLPMMIEGGLMIFGFRHIGKAIEESLKIKVMSELKFRNRAPLQVEKVLDDDNNLSESYSTKALKPKDIIIVRRGEIIPVDGICLNERTDLYDTILTGSPLPRHFCHGEKIVAGMQVPEHVPFIKMRVTQTEATSYLARLDEKILRTNVEKAPIENTANKILQYFVPAVIGLAILSGIVIGILYNPALAIQCATSLLVSACPCTLGFITPMSIKVGMTKANENGVTFKSGKALQQAAEIDTVVFDLNGTLTTGMPHVVDYKITSQASILSPDFFDCLALIEAQSSHPIAKAISEFVQMKKWRRNPHLILTQIDKSHHAGMHATINGERYAVGNEKMMLEHGINISAFAKKLSQKNSQHIVYLAKENHVIGYVLLEDPLREDAKKTVMELQALGKEVHICTGADKNTATHYAKLLGIPNGHVYANCVGSNDDSTHLTKVNYIKKLQQAGKKVGMVGDAANDTLAIATSDFGIAIKSSAGDEMTQQQAGAIIERTSLLPVVTTFAVAKKTVRNIKENLIMSLSYNSIIMLIAGGIFVAIGLTLNPAIGVALMVLQTSLVLLNQYRLRKQSLPHLQKKHPILQNNNKMDSYQHFQQRGLTNKKIFRQLDLSPTIVMQNTHSLPQPLFKRSRRTILDRDQQHEPSISFSLK